MDMFPQREHSPREFWLAHVKAWRAIGRRPATGSPRYAYELNLLVCVSGR